MNSQALPPPVPPPHGKWSYAEQMRYTMPFGNGSGEAIYVLGDAVRDAVSEVVHKFGVSVEHGWVYRYDRKVVVNIILTAGKWRGLVKFQSSKGEGVARKVCTKTLRFIEAHHEELG